MVAALALLAIAGGLAVLGIPHNYQLVPVLVVPAAVVVVLILLNPYLGVVIYLLFEYLRPYDIIPALLPLKLPMAVVIVTTVSWVIRLARTKRLVWNEFSWLYVAFVALVGFTVVSADNYYFALQVSREVLVVFLMFLAATNIVDRYERLQKIVWLMLLIHFVHAVRGIYNYVFSEVGRISQHTSGAVGTSFLADENDFALALNVMIPFAFFTLVYSKKFYLKAVSFVVLAGFVFGVMSSFSRGGWVGLVAAIAFCLLRTRRRVLSFSLAAVLAVALLLIAPGEYWEEINTISDTRESTAATRLNYWKAAVKMYLDHPIVGVGANNGGPFMPDYVTGYDNPATQWGRAFHGTLPQVLAELGSIGIALYVAMIVLALRYLLRIRKSASAAGSRVEAVRYADSITGGIVAYLVTGTFLSTAYFPQLWTLFTLTMVLVRCQLKQDESLDLPNVPVSADKRSVSRR